MDEGEIRRAGAFAAAKAAAKSDSELQAELGNHSHGRADIPAVALRERVATEWTTVAAAETGDDDRPLYADVALFLAGDLPDPPTPTVLARQDGRQLFYRGQVNTVFGDPESGKTFVALAACAESLCAGGRAVFLDLDHNTMPAIVLRLLMFGVPREVLADPGRFRYCEPMGAADLHRVVPDCERWRPDVVVVDSLGELLPMLGASSDSADDFTRAHSAVLKPLARSDAAVIVVDHLAKNPTSRTHGPGGTMAKRRVLGGVSLRVKVARAFAPGKGGSAYLIVNKDRHGGVRAHCAAGEREPMAGTFVLDPPDADGVCGWRVVPALPSLNVDERGREYLAALREAAPAAVTAEQLAELVSGEPPATKSQTEKARHWLARLSEEGHAEIAREGGRGRGQSTWKWAEPRAALAVQPTLLEVEG
ncbi:AAA family ATPase [Mycolicibacterium sp. A43C]